MIQVFAAIISLVGTERFSVQVSSALTRGYLHAATSPISIFGSLGVVYAGFATLVSCISFGDIEGAKILTNIGFKPLGENLSLIMIEPQAKGQNKGRYIIETPYIIETRMDRMIEKLNIDKNRITGVSHKSAAAWNVKMMATTALLCAFSITPYIHLNNLSNDLKKSTMWVYPGLRATGGFITATLIQLLIQRRITTLSDQYLSNKCRVKRDWLPVPNRNVVAVKRQLEPGPGHTKKHQMDACTWLLLFLLLIGLMASVVGYGGCLVIVQNSTSNEGPVNWLCLEVGLLLLRLKLAIWTSNPERDALPLEIILELDEHKPLTICF
jgi:hypothetical protein